MNGKAANQLRDLIERNRLVVAPGVYDCIGARLAERAGYEALYMTGYGTSAARRGLPDYGLLTMSEMAENAAAIVASTRLPVIADADTGYGNELNVVRTVREYRRAGVAALHIEDQTFPKRCGHLRDKEVVGREDFLSRIRAAVGEAREGQPLIVIARTDAIAVAGFEEALWRANHALEAGAEMVFVEAPEDFEQLAAIPQRVKGPCLLNVVRGGRSPEIALDEAEKLGYRVAILPTLLLEAAVQACESALAYTRENRREPQQPPPLGPEGLSERFGREEWDRLRHRFHN